eukprot:CAMPEP_0202006114 /NCGR_PEP_ID=MMETSP0905-20130828/10965_1 /ASSEMBLY_ACC=CAM_ASM_000554 /TAXON_ID=420261 /ORGANISM="Thalassiosira antarctica, Strain CCMP982" /LENGTH=196 /DNA_ID=CAMNT_0048563815 /DNA_START=110 /DNA_END=700 /DNA_ORIENTATION=+
MLSFKRRDMTNSRILMIPQLGRAIFDSSDVTSTSLQVIVLDNSSDQEKIKIWLKPRQRQQNVHHNEELLLSPPKGPEDVANERTLAFTQTDLLNENSFSTPTSSHYHYQLRSESTNNLPSFPALMLLDASTEDRAPPLVTLKLRIRPRFRSPKGTDSFEQRPIQDMSNDTSSSGMEEWVLPEALLATPMTPATDLH